MKEYIDTVEGEITPLKNSVLVTDIDSLEEKVINGVIIPNELGQERGIRPRWATVYAIGEEVTDVNVGDRILVSHGRWTRGVKLVKDGKEDVVRMVDVDEILGIAE